MWLSNPRTKTHQADSKNAVASTGQLRKTRTVVYDQRLVAAQRYIQKSVRSVQEVREHLKRNGVSEEAAEAFIAGAHSRNWLDDRSAAVLWAEHYARKGYAWVYIQERLLQKGFAVRLIERVAKESQLPATDEARARALVANSKDACADIRQKSRLARRLALHGFDSEMIEQLLGDSTNCISAA